MDDSKVEEKGGGGRPRRGLSPLRARVLKSRTESPVGLRRIPSDESLGSIGSVSDAAEFLSDLGTRAGMSLEFLSRPYLARLAFSLCFFLVCAYLNTLASVVAGYRTPWIVVKRLDGSLSDRYTLPDVGHDLCEWLLVRFGFDAEYVPGYEIPDVMVSSLTKFTLVFIFAHPKRTQLLRRAIVILGIVMWMRCLSVTMTNLPDASPTCQSQFHDPTGRGAYKSRKIFPRAFVRAWIFFWAPTSHVTCGDMIFSGHTTFLMLHAMIFNRYCRADYMETRLFIRGFLIPEWACKAVRYTVYVYALVGACLIIGTRLHYTLDVALALYTTYWTFQHYHTWLPPTADSNRLFRWFECEYDVIGREDRAYDRARKKR